VTTSIPIQEPKIAPPKPKPTTLQRESSGTPTKHHIANPVIPKTTPTKPETANKSQKAIIVATPPKVSTRTLTPTPKTDNKESKIATTTTTTVAPIKKKLEL